MTAQGSSATVRNGTKRFEPLKSKSGEIKWLPGGYTHTLTNAGKSPARLVTVEF